MILVLQSSQDVTDLGVFTEMAAAVDQYAQIVRSGNVVDVREVETFRDVLDLVTIVNFAVRVQP